MKSRLRIVIIALILVAICAGGFFAARIYFTPDPFSGTPHSLRQVSFALQNYALEKSDEKRSPYPQSLSDLVPAFMTADDFKSAMNNLRFKYSPPDAGRVPAEVVFTAVDVKTSQNYRIILHPEGDVDIFRQKQSAGAQDSASDMIIVPHKGNRRGSWYLFSQ